MPSPTTKSGSRTKRRLLVGFATLLLILVLFPFWSVFLARPLLHAFTPIQVDSVSAPSWRSWQIEGLQFESPQIELSVQQATLPSPTAWLLGRPVPQTLAIQDWRLDLKPAPQNQAPAQPIPSPGDLLNQIQQAASLVEQNIHAIELRSGIVTRDQAPLLEVETLRSQGSQLELHARISQPDTSIQLTTDLQDPQTWLLDLQLPAQQSSLSAKLAQTRDQILLSGRILSKQNAIDFQATWDPLQAELLPKQAHLDTATFALDRRYGDWASAIPLTLDANFQWADNAYRYEIQNVDTDPQSPRISLSGHGDRTSTTLQTAQIDLPWLSLSNDAPLAIDFTQEDPLQAARLKLRADLAQLPWGQSSGTLLATIQTLPTPDETPLLAAEIVGQQIAISDTKLVSLEAKLVSQGQRIAIDSLQFTSEADSHLSLSGGIQLETRSLEDIALSFDLRNEPAIAPLLPEGLSWQRISGNLNAAGPLQDPQLGGSLEISGLETTPLKPFNATAQLSGSRQKPIADLSIQAEATQLDLNLALEQGPDATTVQVSNLLIQSDSTELLRQTQSSRIALAPQTLGLDRLELQGPDATRIKLSDVSYSPDAIAFQLLASEFTPENLGSWTADPLPSFRIQSLDTQVDLNATGGHATFSGKASWPLDSENTIDASWQARQGPETRDFLQIDLLEIGASGKSVAQANGAFPLSIGWADSQPQSTISQEAPLALSLKSVPHPEFWASIQDFIPFAISKPNIDAQLAGSLSKPRGNIDLQLATLEWKNPDSPSQNLKLQNLQTQLELTPSIIRADTFTANIGNNRVSANATLPLKTATLREILEEPQQLDLDQLTGKARLQIDDLPSIAAILPDFIRQQGSANIDIDLQPGDLAATAEIRGIATRPLPPLGAFSDLSGRIELKDGIWSTEGLAGQAEQSPFLLVGKADLSNLSAPLYDLRFTSDEFPLLRDEGLLFTGDIDLQLVSGKSEQPTLSGSLLLSKGLVLVEPELLSSSTRTTSQRPPYFAVEREPFKVWNLDVDLRGDRFLRVSNSFFEGLLSADFRLDGTLGNPLLVGKAKAEQGRILLPASSLSLLSGEAEITRANPTEIQIEANARGRVFAHDINLQASGSIEQPDVTITTNPALSQVDALLLVTTGKLPQGASSIAQQSATSIGLFLGKGLFRKLLGPSDSELGDRLSLEVGQDISLQGKRTIEATYQITDTLEIEGEYDKRDEYNANFKWTFFKR